MVKAQWNGALIAESDSTVVVDGNHYFPADSVNSAYLEPSDKTTVCSWKGHASYYSLHVDGKTNRDAAFYYPKPKHAAKKITGHVAFWRGVTIVDDRSPQRRSVFDRLRRRSSNSTRSDPTDAPTTAVVTELDDASFFNAIDQHVSIADFWAPWCGPCKQLHPMFDAAASNQTGGTVQFVRVNVDESPGVATAFNVMSIPTIIVFDADSQEVDREIGVPTKRRLDQMIRGAHAVAKKSAGQRTV